MYPETLWVMVGLVITIVSAIWAYSQAVDARAERRIANQLKTDMVVIAENMTKMAFIVADGTRGYGGISDEHLQVIRQYENAIRAYLPPDIDTEIRNTIKDLEKPKSRQGQ